MTNLTQVFKGFKYFNNNLSPGFVALFSGRMIQFAANGMMGLFLPVFLLQKIGRIDYVFLYYLVGSLLYILMLPFLSSVIINKIGINRSLRISVIFDVLFYICMIFIDRNIWLFLLISILILTLSRLTFWTPFHTDFAKFIDRIDRGKGVSLMWATKAFLSILMPIAAGFLITIYGFNVVFIIVLMLLASAVIPFLALPKVIETFSWTAWQTIKNLFKKNNRALVVANIANGAENVVGLIIWPIFIWQVLEGNFLEMGAISSGIIFITILLQLVAGKYTDIFDKRKILRWGTGFYAIGWLAKTFILTASQIFILGAYHSITQIFKNTPFDSLNYEIIADKGHYVDEFTVLREIAVHIGKIIMLALAVYLSLNFGINLTFILAALASLFVNVL